MPVLSREFSVLVSSYAITRARNGTTRKGFRDTRHCDGWFKRPIPDIRSETTHGNYSSAGGSGDTNYYRISESGGTITATQETSPELDFWPVWVDQTGTWLSALNSKANTPQNTYLQQYDRVFRNAPHERVLCPHQFDVGGQFKPGPIRSDLWIRYHESRECDYRRRAEFLERLYDHQRNGNRRIFRSRLWSCRITPLKRCLTTPPVPLQGKRPRRPGVRRSPLRGGLWTFSLPKDPH